MGETDPMGCLKGPQDENGGGGGGGGGMDGWTYAPRAKSLRDV